jgi:uncharacterized protein (TIRG00374 family)
MSANLDSNVAAAPSRRAASGHQLLLRMAVGLGIGGLLVLAFLRLVNVGSVYRRLEHLNVTLALLCGVVFLSAYVVRALRWRLFLAPDKVSVPRVIAIYNVAIFVNWLLPIRGGELVKCLILRRSNGIPVSRGLATVTMDKAMDLLPAVVLLALVPFAQLQLGRLLWVLLLSALVALSLGVLVLGLATWRRDQTLAWLDRFLTTILPRRVSERVEPFVVHFIDTLLALVRKPRLLLKACAFTAVAVSLDALFCYLAFEAVGVSISIPVVLYGYTFYNLAYMLPTPPGQVGSNELVGLLVFSGMFGVSRSGVGAMFLFSHPWTALLMTASGLICLSAMGLSVGRTLRLQSEPDLEGGE